MTRPRHVEALRFADRSNSSDQPEAGKGGRLPIMHTMLSPTRSAQGAGEPSGSSAPYETRLAGMGCAWRPAPRCPRTSSTETRVPWTPGCPESHLGHDSRRPVHHARAAGIQGGSRDRRPPSTKPARCRRAPCAAVRRPSAPAPVPPSTRVSGRTLRVVHRRTGGSSRHPRGVFAYRTLGARTCERRGSRGSCPAAIGAPTTGLPALLPCIPAFPHRGKGLARSPAAAPAPPYGKLSSKRCQRLNGTSPKGFETLGRLSGPPSPLTGAESLPCNGNPATATDRDPATRRPPPGPDSTGPRPGLDTDSRPDRP
jgi:hypothetical protein